MCTTKQVDSDSQAEKKRASQKGREAPKGRKRQSCGPKPKRRKGTGVLLASPFSQGTALPTAIPRDSICRPFLLAAHVTPTLSAGARSRTSRVLFFRLGTTSHPRIFWTSPAPVSYSKALNHKLFSIVLSPFGPGRISVSAFCIC